MPNLPSSERALLQKLMEGEHIPVDVWIDAHHLLRRMVMSLAMNTPAGPALRETVTGDLGEYGPQPRPDAPAG